MGRCSPRAGADGTGADADHLKTTADIDACLAVGFSMFTIDPGEHVDSAADTADARRRCARSAAAPALGRPRGLRGRDCGSRYLGQSVAVEHLTIAFDEATLLRAAVKYGRAVAHVARDVRATCRQAAGPRLVELEVSVDETDTPTSPAEHYWVASELKRLERRVGEPRPALRRPLREGRRLHRRPRRAGEGHRRARRARPALRPVQAQPALGLRQVQRLPDRGAPARRASCTSRPRAPATSRRCAPWPRSTPRFFRAIYAFARERYDTDKASYHVSAELAKAPRARRTCPRPTCPGLLEQFDAREILHVTFGSVLKETGAGREAPLQGHALRPAALEPRGLRRQPRAPLRQAPAALRRRSRRSTPTQLERAVDLGRPRSRRPRPRRRLPAGRRGAGDRPRGPRRGCRSTAGACWCSSPTARARCRCRSSSTCSTRRWARARRRSTSWSPSARTRR